MPWPWPADAAAPATPTVITPDALRTTLLERRVARDSKRSKRNHEIAAAVLAQLPVCMWKSTRLRHVHLLCLDRWYLDDDELQEVRVEATGFAAACALAQQQVDDVYGKDAFHLYIDRNPDDWSTWSKLGRGVYADFTAQ